MGDSCDSVGILISQSFETPGAECVTSENKCRSQIIYSMSQVYHDGGTSSTTIFLASGSGDHKSSSIPKAGESNNGENL